MQHLGSGPTIGLERWWHPFSSLHFTGGTSLSADRTKEAYVVRSFLGEVNIYLPFLTCGTADSTPRRHAVAV
jgi:hypothetical protein